MSVDLNENLRFWDIRSANYDKLFWVKDKSYIDAIIEAAELSKDHIILDVGTGTGIISNAVKKFVQHVVAVDISHSMLEKGEWEGVSMVKWDISNSLFTSSLFDRVIARMVFHHVLDNLDRAILRCFDILKEGGKIVVAEGVPPSDDEEVINWYKNMFKLKEKRRTFTLSKLRYYLEKNGFKNIKSKIHVMEKFSINDWLLNSGLPENTQKKIYEIHVNSNSKIKEVYNMKIINGECFVRTINTIITGQK